MVKSSWRAAMAVNSRLLAALGAGVVAGMGLSMLLRSSPGSAAAPAEAKVEAKVEPSSGTAVVVDPASLAPGKPVGTAGVLAPGRGQ